MSQLNRPPPSLPAPRTHQGAPAARLSAEAELRRTMCACLLWEDSFYESGGEIAQRIRELVNSTAVNAEFVMNLAVELRSQHNLRHAPLILVRELLRFSGPKHGLAQCIAQVIQRPDELAELCAMFWSDARDPFSSADPKGKRKGLPRQLKKGLALAFQKFSAHALAKYNRENAVQLRDVLFMCHAKPKAEPLAGEKEVPVAVFPAIDKPSYKRGAIERHYHGQGKIWAQLAERKLASPDTWEVALSAGADKKETFTRLLAEGKLGYLALLRNLRNMAQAGVDPQPINSAILARQGGAERVLPYRFIAAATAAPQFEPALDQAMQASLEGVEKLPGMTFILVDGSGSMKDQVSAKSDLTRFDAGCGLAILAQATCAHSRVFVFSHVIQEVPSRPGMALRDALHQRAAWSSTYLGAAVGLLNSLPHDRLIVLTDEQSHDPVPKPAAKGYMLNVASYRNGVSHGPWVSITGWSEAAIRFIQELERLS